MSFDNIQAEISLLVKQMEEQPHDAHELQETLREKLNELRAFGMPLPEELVRVERKLDEMLSQNTDK